MSRIRIILVAGGCSLALSGCLPAVAGLALSAASLVTGGGDGKGGNGFTNPIDRQTTGRQIRQALSRLDEQVDPGCQAMLEEHQRTHGTLVAGTAAQSPDSASETKPSAPSDADAGKQAPQPVNLLAKLKPDPDAAAGADVSVAADSVAAGPTETTSAPAANVEDQTTESTASSGSSGDGQTESIDADPATADAKPVKASLGTTSAPGQCEHRFVCLPGTPKPTLMLMCPGKGKGKGGAEPETTTASDSPDTPVDSETTEPAQAGTQTVDASPDASAEPAPPTPASETAAASPSTPDAGPAGDETPVRRTIEGGGVSDWNWSYDPSKRL